ncbi:MAG: hypothetical protein ACM3JG_19070 [Thiohalocapsa sp.]
MAKQERPQQPAGPNSNNEKGPHHVADEPVAEIEPEEPTEQPPTTETGLVVEDQIQKEWDPQKDGGLPTFLRKSPGKHSRKKESRTR